MSWWTPDSFKWVKLSLVWNSPMCSGTHSPRSPGQPLHIPKFLYSFLLVLSPFCSANSAAFCSWLHAFLTFYAAPPYWSVISSFKPSNVIWRLSSWSLKSWRILEEILWYRISCHWRNIYFFTRKRCILWSETSTWVNPVPLPKRTDW